MPGENSKPMRDFETSGRSAVYASNGMAATSHPRATLAALDVLRAGGNAVDAAVAAAAVLAVVEPQMTGIGGDCFILYAPEGGRSIAYNGSGRACAGISTQWCLENGFTSIESDSPHAVTVPGAVDAWVRVLADHGTRDLGSVLQPAIHLAEEGWPVQPRIAFDWHRMAGKLSANADTRRAFLPGGRPLEPGDMFRNPALARTLRTIAEKGRDGFYRGVVAEAMSRTLSALGGLQTPDDFAAHSGEYADPVAGSYRGHTILECPPNGQGFVALIMANLLEGFDLSALDPEGADKLHLLIETSGLAFRARDGFFRSDDWSLDALAPLLGKEMAARWRDEIDMGQARAAADVGASGSDTVYLCVVDRDANAVSFINSLFRPFGSGILCPDTGVMFHDRGTGFVVQSGSGRTIEGGRRPPHTILPAMLLRDGKAVMPFGFVGAEFQPIGQITLLTNVLDHGLDVQQALETARVFPQAGDVKVEKTVKEGVVRDLQARGHRIGPTQVAHGSGQAIWIDRDRGVLIGGSDPRKDGCALGF